MKSDDQGRRDMHMRTKTTIFLAAVVLLASGPVVLVSSGQAEAAFACRMEGGKRKCGLVETVPVPSAVPAPGVSPNTVQGVGATPQVGAPARSCSKQKRSQGLCR